MFQQILMKLLQSWGFSVLHLTVDSLLVRTVFVKIVTCSAWMSMLYNGLEDLCFELSQLFVLNLFFKTRT